MPITQRGVDGGASANSLVMLIQADILDVAVDRTQLTEATAMGAAYLAGIGIGFWENAESIGTQWQMVRIFEPSMSDKERRKIRSTWCPALMRAREWEIPE